MNKINNFLKVENNKITGRTRHQAINKGTNLISPETIFLSKDTKIGKKVTIEPYVVIGKKVRIGDNVIIKSFSHIEGAVLEKNVTIGPFARIRPGTKIEQGAKVGNFVETKNSKIKKDSKISHLSYIGDTVVGDQSNIGAGTITCNYDGKKKNKTKIGKKVFIGSNSSLVAPVSIENNSTVGAGSVITKNVKKNSLAISRAKQIQKLNYRKK